MACQSEKGKSTTSAIERLRSATCVFLSVRVPVVYKFRSFTAHFFPIHSVDLMDLNKGVWSRVARENDGCRGPLHSWFSGSATRILRTDGKTKEETNGTKGQTQSTIQNLRSSATRSDFLRSRSLSPWKIEKKFPAASATEAFHDGEILRAMDVYGEGKAQPEGLVVALLDFPKGGTFGLDGQSIVPQTEDFLGVRGVPRGAFHLVTCKNGNASRVDTNSNSNSNSNNATPNTLDTAVTVGFLVYGDTGERSDNNGAHHLVRKYDPQTEEVASEERHAVDDITKRNLVQRMTSGSLPPTRVLRYDQIVGAGANEEEPDVLSQQRIWREQTRYIHDPSPGKSSISLLEDLRNLPSGEKIVPGCYDPEDEAENHEGAPKTVPRITDGRSPVYPPIPVVDPGLSLAKHKHSGTNRFLSGLAPRERTGLFLAASAGGGGGGAAPNFVWLDRVLKDHYRGSWEALLGDLQLSYVLFLYLGCYASLEHWKDLLAMLSLAVGGVDGSGGRGGRRGPPRERSGHAHEYLYRGLLRLLPYQLSSMTDPEFLEDIDEGGGNFLLPSLLRLKRYYETERRHAESDDAVGTEEEEEEEDLRSRFRHVLSAKFPRTFPVRPSLPTITRIRSNSDGSDTDHGGTDGTAHSAMEMDTKNEGFGWAADEDDDEDGPVIVSSGEIEASMARANSAGIGANANANANASDEAATRRLRREYPLLAAAVMPSEDVLMTCARALDEQTDVSLVREAAAYLQEVEDDRRGFF